MNGDDVVISVKDISKTFKLLHEKNNSIKSAVVNFHRRDKSYKVLRALNDISFEVKKGEFFGIVGRNGSGKSTLLKLLAGIYVPTKGAIRVDGKLIPFIELGVGFSPELSGRDNVFLNGALLGFGRKEMTTMYKDIVDFAELERFMDQKLKNYSSGMQVRLAFSIAIRAKGDILLLDEVLAVGDAAFQQKCFNYFEELKREGKTVVFVSHDMSAIKRFCTKAVYIKDSRLTHQGTPTEIADVYLEENINKTPRQTTQGDVKNSSNHEISFRIVEQANDKLLLNFSHRSQDKEEVYIGISVIRDGVSIAEINSLPDATLKGNGKLSYTLDTSFLNGGVYDIACALFKRQNRELVSMGKNKCEFLIKADEDSTKGAALKLADTWEHEHIG